MKTWSEHRADVQAGKKRRRADGTAEILRLESVHGLTVRTVTPYQFRINERLDIYPTNRKFCDLACGEWGRYKSLELLVRAHFEVAA